VGGRVRLRAALAALFVTLLWSSSWVLIKWGIQDVPALTFAALRYGLATLCLLPFVGRRAQLAPLRELTRGQWAELLALGLVYYTLTQGAIFVALAHLPAVTFSLALNFTAPLVALSGIVALRETPRAWQWLGMGLFLLGAWLYFAPAAGNSGPVLAPLGVAAAALAVTANALAALQGRRVNRAAHLPPSLVTLVSMGGGALGLIAAAALFDTWPTFPDRAAALRFSAILIWLAVVNTAFAFTLWNATLRVLTALESSIINGTMLIQIALLAWIFLGERIGPGAALGLLLAGIGALVVQLPERRRPAPP
jgi:drug/metabolite transporter (DMT)-like permease